MGIEKYNEEEFDEWCEKHIEWMKKNDIKFSAPFEGWPRSYRNNEKD